MMKKLSLFFVMLFCTAAFAQDLPKIAVYVTGDVPENEKSALGTRMLASFINSGRYRGIERSNTFLAEIEKEQVTQRSGSIDDSQISALGKRFGVRHICIANIIPAFDSFQISARIVDVETAEVIFIGEAFSPLKSANDLTQVSDEVVKIMFRGQVASKPQPQSQPLPTSALEPKPLLKLEPTPVAPTAPVQTTIDVMNEGNIESVEKSALSPRESKKRMSIGAGGFFASDFGGGIVWDKGGQVIMPYYGGGAYLFLDVVHAEFFVGYSGGSGKWEVPGLSNMPYMPRTYINIGAVLKYSIGDQKLKLSPLAGIEYEMAIFGKLKYPAGNEYVFDGSRGRNGNKNPEANALSALWIKTGCGLDIGLSQSTYLRTELLYGIRTANQFEKNEVDIEKGASHDVKTGTGHGFTLRVGIGVKF